MLKSNGSRELGSPVILANAVSGEPVAEIDSTGVDFAGMLDHARRVGGPALRKMTFHERALMLKAIAQYLMARKDEFYEVSAATGATRTDSWIDIEGGIGTFFAYASQGRREFPNRTFYLDGPTESCPRAAPSSASTSACRSKASRCISTRSTFPVWGMLEKLAPTLLAGVPAIVKPATVTSYLTEADVPRDDRVGVLPEGAMQLICGSDRRSARSSRRPGRRRIHRLGRTGQKLKRIRAIIEQRVRFNMEADSLNYSMLGPDAAPGTPEFDLFVKEVVREMTVKAGQKCTAIRRTLVPRDRVSSRDRGAARPARQDVVGDPARRGGAHGRRSPAGAARARCARASRELAAEAEIVYGDRDEFEVVGADRRARRVPAPDPVLLPTTRRAAEVHDVEAFGPVSTVHAV